MFVAVGWQWVPWYRDLRWLISRTSDDRWVWRIRRILSSSGKSKLSERRQGRAVPVQAYYRPWGFREFEALRYQDILHMKVLTLSAPRTGRLYSSPTPGNIPGTHFCRNTRRCSWLRHCATRREVAGSIPDVVIAVFHWHNPSGRAMALRSIQPLTEIRTRNFSWGVKAAGA
jgi:hypothetical protein